MTPQRTPALLRSAALIAIAALLLTGCSNGANSETAAHEQQAQNFPEIYAQTVNWGSCETDFQQDDPKAIEAFAASERSASEYECALIEAPLDWNDPENPETITIAAAKLPAISDEPLGTLFVNPGGPGGSAVVLAYRVAAMEGAQAVRDSYDVIGVDPRGIGLSSPLNCEFNSDLLEVVYASCAEEQPLARSMGTSQAARDLELVRTLEADPQFNYLGYSYGTILGATYATLFPDTVGRMVLDSSIDEEWATPLGTYRQMLATHEEVELLLDGCGTEYEVAKCPIHSIEELMSEQQGEVLENGEATGLVSSDGIELGGYDLYRFLQSNLYGTPERRLEGLTTLGDAFAGDQTAVDAIATELNNGGASVQLGGQIVTCHSQPHDPNVMGLIEAIDANGVPETFGGDEYAVDFLHFLLSLPCAALAETGTDLMEFSGPTDTPILVVGITGDHATPYESGQRLASTLPNSAFVTLEGHGHAASFTGRSTCVNAITESFLLDGTTPEDGTVCAAD